MADYLKVLRRDIEQFSKGNWTVDNDKLLMYLEELNANTGGGGGGGVPYVGATQDVDLGNYGLFTDFVNFNLNPVSAPGAGQIAYNGATGSLAYNLDNRAVQCEIGQQLFAYITNAEAVQINKGEVVYLYQASGNRASVKLAYNTSDATSAKTFGLAAENIPAGQTGFIICQGVLDKLNTGMYNPGDSLYLGSTPGTYVTTKPSAPEHLVYIGTVERANNGNGQIYVRIQNGYELNEIHDVAISSPNNGDVLTYDNTVTPPLWRNAAPVNDITTYSNNNIVDSVLDSVNYTGATKVSSTGPGTIEVSSNYASPYYQQISGAYYPLTSPAPGTSIISFGAAGLRYVGFFFPVYFDFNVTISELLVYFAPASTLPVSATVYIYTINQFLNSASAPYYTGNLIGSSLPKSLTAVGDYVNFIMTSPLSITAGVYCVGVSLDSTAATPNTTLGCAANSIYVPGSTLSTFKSPSIQRSSYLYASTTTPILFGPTLQTSALNNTTASVSIAIPHCGYRIA